MFPVGGEGGGTLQLQICLVLLRQMRYLLQKHRTKIVQIVNIHGPGCVRVPKCEKFLMIASEEIISYFM